MEPNELHINNFSDNRDSSLQKIGKPPKITKFSKQKLEELVQAKRLGFINDEHGGITLKKGTKEFGVLDNLGLLAFFNGVSGKLSKQLLVNGSTPIKFSPSQRNFLVFSKWSMSLFIFDSKSLKMKKKITNECADFIQQAKWVSETEVLVGYWSPGELLLYRLERNKPVKRFISVETTRAIGIKDFDFSECRKFAYCGNSSGVLYKISIKKEKDNLFWTHSTNGSFTAVRAAQNKRFICVSNFGKELLLISEKDGTRLFKFEEFSSERILGVVLCPEEKMLLAWSCNELVLLKANLDLGGGEIVRKLDEIKREEIQINIRIADAFWGKKLREETKEETGCVVLGDSFGRIFRVWME